MKSRPLLYRMMSKTVMHDQCWIWVGSRSGTFGGYGYVRVGADRGGGRLPAHRAMYQELVGPVPEGMTLDHLCRNRGCVNPDHLEPVTMRENALRGTSPWAKNARKTHCPRGHELVTENCVPYYLKRGRRYCAMCARETSRRAYLKSRPSQPSGNRTLRVDPQLLFQTFSE